MIKITGGNFGVPLEKNHFRELLRLHVTPPPKIRENTSEEISTNFVEMCFPRLEMKRNAICACHKTWKSSGYVCPRCYSLSCDMPGTCGTCSLPMVIPHKTLFGNNL